jgi:hypothetical protein
MTVGHSVPLFPMIILSEIVFLVIVHYMILLPTIMVVGMYVALFFFMLIPVQLGMGLSPSFEQQLHSLLC